ncbi:Na+/H+ antiporter subunit C [Niveispirillum sp.]|uniref:Na+/H+ antiporter subunit C n=1 Tax=Niveispirillum sp. TaxID=1917217 RepID=UPI001B545B84|nr:Na+/H+ antiporter subunit C [Niveispirillum sp.]MBP7335132.1 Na+/H+ antiporter subunit C [Niveispirillum sp.]
MEVIMALTVGGMVAGSVYLFLSRQYLRVMFGVIVLSNAVNVAILTVGRLTSGRAPLISRGNEVMDQAAANPLPQALILTAIVIGFGLLAFALALGYRAYQEMGTLDTAAMRAAEPEDKR